MTEFLVRHFVKDYENVKKGVCANCLRSAGKCNRHLL